MNTTSDSNLEMILTACAELTASGRNVTTATVKFHIPKTVPFPETVRGVLAWQKMTDDEKRIMTEKYRAGNSTAEEKNEHALPEEGYLNGTAPISDDDFLKLTPDDRLLYLKRLLEAVLIKSNTLGRDWLSEAPGKKQRNP